MPLFSYGLLWTPKKIRQISFHFFRGDIEEKENPRDFQIIHTFFQMVSQILPLAIDSNIFLHANVSLPLELGGELTHRVTKKYVDVPKARKMTLHCVGIQIHE